MKKSPAPKHLGTEGIAIWNKHCDRTNDCMTLELYASTYERWLAAKADIDKNGMTLILANERGQQTAKANPACGVEAASARIIMACERKLGSALQPPEADPFAEFTDPNWREKIRPE